MEATRPALARALARIEDEPASFTYDEKLQISVLADGSPAVNMPGSRIETFATTDPAQPGTSTRATRDPGDLDEATMSLHRVAETRTMTEAARDRDPDAPDPDESFADDSVTGVVAF